MGSEYDAKAKALYGQQGAVQGVRGGASHASRSKYKDSGKLAGKGIFAMDSNPQRTAIRFRSQVLCRLRPIAFVWLLLAVLTTLSIIVPFSSVLPTTRKHAVGAVPPPGKEAVKSSLSPFSWSFSPRMKGNRPGGLHSPPVSAPTARCTPPDATGRQFFLLGKPFELVGLNVTRQERERGIVIAASNVERLSVGAYVTCYLVRRVLGSKLPIEIYYVGENEALPEHTVKKLEELGDVRVLDLMHALDERYGMFANEHPGSSGSTSNSKFAYLAPTVEQLRSYAAKPYAVLASSFRENILFDAGAVPFQMPDTFLDMSTYRASGFSIFRDYVPYSKGRWDWLETEVCVSLEELATYYDGTEADSSCVLIDKTRNWDALIVTAILNGPMQSITYKRLNGDKDTWVLGMMYTKHKLEPLPTTPGFLFIDYLGDSWGRKVHGQLQLLKVGRVEGGGTSEPGEQAGLVPLYFNNQLFNFTDWDYNRDWTYVGSYEDYGSLYNPPESLSPDCSPYDVNSLDKLSAPMVRAFDGVVEALRELGSNHCACRDDWPSQCVFWIW